MEIEFISLLISDKMKLGKTEEKTRNNTRNMGLLDDNKAMHEWYP